MSQFFTSGAQSIGASASPSVLPMNIQAWFPLELTGLISKRLSRVCIYGYSSLPFHHTRRFTETIAVVKMQDDSSPQSPPWFCPILITPSHHSPPLWQPLTVLQFHDIVISRMLYKWNCRGHDVLRWAYYLHHSVVLPRSIPWRGWTYHTSLGLSLIKGHLGWLQFVTTPNKAAMNNCVHVFAWTKILFLWYLSQSVDT